MSQVVRGELAGAQVTLEDQILAVLDVVVHGRARQPDAFRNLVDRRCRDAARIELPCGLVEQCFALRRPGRRARQLGACHAGTPAPGRRLAPALLLARLRHAALQVV
jgi:hypothetical protein